MKKQLTVKLVYRNYKPLHKIYETVVTYPPEGVNYVVPEVRNNLRAFFKWYKFINKLPILRRVVYAAERVLFLGRSDDTNIDLYHYVNIIDSNIPNKPYVIDIEHATALISFSADRSRISKVVDFLDNTNCKSINCMSQAAKKSLENLLGDNYHKVSDKVDVIYPALPLVDTKNFKSKDTYITNSKDRLKLLFVGNLAYLKGLEEVLYAVKKINAKNSFKLELHVISSDAKDLVETYGLNEVFLYPPRFSSREIIEEFYLPADVFLLPTKSDTFGMAILDSLSSGTPVIATRQFAIPELVTDNVDGVLIDLENPLLDTISIPNNEDFDKIIQPNFNLNTANKLVAILDKMVNKQIDLKTMQKNSMKKFISGGKFSLDVRNTKLLEVYKNATK